MYRACEGKINFPGHFFWDIIILIYYFSLEFNELLRLSPTGRIVLLLLSCLIMYFGGWFYTANAFYSKTSLFYFTDILTYKKQLLPIPFINGWTVLHS